MKTWSQQEQEELHESSANRLYECKPVKKEGKRFLLTQMILLNMKSLIEFMFQQEDAISSRNLWDKCPTSGGVQGNTMLLEESGDDRDTQNNTIRFDVKIKKPS